MPSAAQVLRVAEHPHLQPLEPLSNYPRIGRVNGTARPFKGRESTARIQLRNIVAALLPEEASVILDDRGRATDEAQGPEGRRGIPIQSMGQAR